MANTTPFRMIDKEAQRTFKVKYRLDGHWFNKIYAHYVEPVRGSFPVNYDLALLRERIQRNGLGKTWRPADELEHLTDEIVELMRQAYTNLFKLNKKAERSGGTIFFDSKILISDYRGVIHAFKRE